MVSECDIEKIVDRAVDRTLAKVGIFVDDPQEMQGMMHFLNTQYKSNMQLKSDFRRSMLSVMSPPIAIAVWEGIKHALYM